VRQPRAECGHVRPETPEGWTAGEARALDRPRDGPQTRSAPRQPLPSRRRAPQIRPWHAVRSAFSEAALFCQEPRRSLPFVGRSSLVASVLSALFGEGWAKRDAPGCPTIDATEPGRPLPLPQNQQLRACDPSGRPSVRAKPVEVCDDLRSLPRGSSPFSSRS
jgi:hypothetical protein